MSGRSKFLILKDIWSQNPNLIKILERTPQLQIVDWYVGAGGIAQTYWNYKHGFDLNTGIKDFDLVYFDPDLSAEKEQDVQRRGNELFKDIPIEVEITNQARVHM